VNQALTQLIASQLAANADGQSSEELLKAAGDNPMAAMMATLGKQRNTEAQQLKRYRRRLKQTRRTLEAMRSQVQEAENVLQELAAIFGACPRCWGQDEECPDCRGKGGPGSHTPDPEELLALTEPALAQLNLCVVPLEQVSDTQSQPVQHGG
jgi:DNA repair exonuclease SbcCD ATPase subunit